MSSYDTMRPRYLNCCTHVRGSLYAVKVWRRAALPWAATAYCQRAAAIYWPVLDASCTGVPTVDTCMPQSRHFCMHTPPTATLSYEWR